MKSILDVLETKQMLFFIEARKAELGNKAAGARARKLSMEIRKLLKEWKSNSISK
jgi:hypothetical protein